MTFGSANALEQAIAVEQVVIWHNVIDRSKVTFSRTCRIFEHKIVQVE